MLSVYSSSLMVASAVLQGIGSGWRCRTGRALRARACGRATPWACWWRSSPLPFLLTHSLRATPWFTRRQFPSPSPETGAPLASSWYVCHSMLLPACTQQHANLPRVTSCVRMEALAACRAALAALHQCRPGASACGLFALQVQGGGAPQAAADRPGGQFHAAMYGALHAVPSSGQPAGPSSASPAGRAAWKVLCSAEAGDVICIQRQLLQQGPTPSASAGQRRHPGGSAFFSWVHPRTYRLCNHRSPVRGCTCKPLMCDMVCGLLVQVLAPPWTLLHPERRQQLGCQI